MQDLALKLEAETKWQLRFCAPLDGLSDRVRLKRRDRVAIYCDGWNDVRLGTTEEVLAFIAAHDEKYS